MAKIYANLIIAGRKTRDDVPYILLKDVGLILLEHGFIDKTEFEAQYSNKGESD